MAKMTLYGARHNCKLSQKKAAEAIGVSVSTIKNWENQKSFPSQPHIEKICSVYGVEYDDLIFLPS